MTDEANQGSGKSKTVPITINWDTTTTEASTITAIAERYLDLIHHEFPDGGAKLALRMDLTACHLNGCPLDLDGLLAADDFALAHDVQLIDRHLNRDTGKLGLRGEEPGVILPRCALPQVTEEA